MPITKIIKSPTPIELLNKVNELTDLVNIARGVSISATTPSDTSILWLNTANRTLNYHDGSKWNTVVGTYG